MSDGLFSLLQFIIGVCGTGDCTVFSAEDFFEERSGEAWDEPALARAVDALEEVGCIAVKYAGDGMYCVRLLPQGRTYSVRARERAFETVFERTRCRNAAFWGGLSGGALGGLFFFLLFLLFR